MDVCGCENDDNEGGNNSSSSIERALSDIEIVRSAYPDETTSTQQLLLRDDGCDDGNHSTPTTKPEVPLRVTLYLSKRQKSYIILEWKHGYPIHTPLQISMYRDNNSNKQRIEQTVQAVRATALECFKDGIEAGLECCSTAFDTWNNCDDNGVDDENDDDDGEQRLDAVSTDQDPKSTPSEHVTTMTITSVLYRWYTSNESNMIHDRKSIFVGHVCPISAESDIQPALQQLLQNSNKLQRATHHMYAYRVREEKIVIDRANNGAPSTTRTISILKYDSNDDGEDGAGIRLSQLLQLRNEMNLFVVVSRWFGGIHLGSKRFAHIVAAAQIALTEYHNIQNQQQQ